MTKKKSVATTDLCSSKKLCRDKINYYRDKDCEEPQTYVAT